MYRLDWIENLKLGKASLPAAKEAASVSPTVWRLGFTSLLTDISAEMVNSTMPMYLVLYLRTSPLTFGVIDGVYHGMAVAVLSLAGGVLADRWQRHKEVAAAGYGLSAICKLGLMVAGSSFLGIGLATAADRVGKGARVAPRDALISLNSSSGGLATAFAVHRALDAGGSLLGPIVAFLILSWLPGAYDALWLTSFVFALLGVAVLWLFVQNPPGRISPYRNVSVASTISLLRTSSQFRNIVLAGGALTVSTLSDGFVYLQLQRVSGLPEQSFPLFYVVTAFVYMVLSVPVGRLADRTGRKSVLMAGYSVLLVIYLILTVKITGAIVAWLVLGLFGLYYAATEGLLTAIASAALPATLRTSGLAWLATILGLGKMISSVAFGWLWHVRGERFATLTLLVALVVAIAASIRLLGSRNHEAQRYQ